MNKGDGTIDFSNRPQEELEAARLAINRSDYPQNYARLLKEIESRKVAGSWSEKNAEFRSEVSLQQGSNIALAIGFVTTFFVVRYIYQTFTGETLEPAGNLILFLSLSGISAYIRYRLMHRVCPNCGRAFGASGGNSQRVLVGGKCPECGFKA